MRSSLITVIAVFFVSMSCVSIHASFIKNILVKLRTTIRSEKALICYKEPQKALMHYDMSLLDAASQGDVIQVSKLLLLGANVHRRDPQNGDTALHKAVVCSPQGGMSCSPIHTVHTLLFAGASPYICNNIGERPIDLVTEWQMKNILTRKYIKRA